MENSYLSHLMTNLANNLLNLPPEIVRIVASHLDRHVLLALSMTNRYCARLFAGIYYNNWEVDCCSDIQEATIRESNEIYTTNMDWFFRALKSGFAPVYAERVHFYFCTHKKPVKLAKRRSKRSLQSNWPLDQTGEFLKLLNASEIVVTLMDSEELDYICNEPFLRALLRDSLCALPNAVVKLRVDNRKTIDIRTSPLRRDFGLFHFTIRDSSTPQAAVADNLRWALSQIRPSSIDHDLWEAIELYTYPPLGRFSGIYPNVTNLSVSEKHMRWNFLAVPDDFVAAFPRRQRLTYRWNEIGIHGRLEATFCFDEVSGQGRQCTKLFASGEFFKWVLWLTHSGYVLRHVKELEFHHTAHKALFSKRWYYPYTPSRLNDLLECLLVLFPNLETMILKFDTGTIITGPNHPGTLSKGCCEHCQLAVKIFEFDIRTMLREGSLRAVRHNNRTAFELVINLWTDISIDEVELSEFFSQRVPNITRSQSSVEPLSRYVIHRAELENGTIYRELSTKPVSLIHCSKHKARTAHSKLSGWLRRACRRLKTRVRLCFI